MTGQFVRVREGGRTVVRTKSLSATKSRVPLLFAVNDHVDRWAQGWQPLFAGIHLRLYRLVQQWRVLRSEARSLRGRIRILRARRVLEVGLPVGRESSRCDNPCSCTCHNDRTPYIRALYQIHAAASLGDLVLLTEVLRMAGKMDDCNSCNRQHIRDA